MRELQRIEKAIEELKKLQRKTNKTKSVYDKIVKWVGKKKFKQLEPSMTKLYNQLVMAEKDGDKRAAGFLEAINNGMVGIVAFCELAERMAEKKRG